MSSQKITYGGRSWGKSAAWAMKFDTNIKFKTKDTAVTIPLNEKAIEAISLFDTIKRDIGYKLIANASLPIIKADKLAKVVNSKTLKNKSKKALKGFYNDAVFSKFNHSGSRIMRWLPISEDTKRKRKKLGISSTKPLNATGALKEAVSDKFFISDYHLYDKQEIERDKMVFKTISVDVAFKGTGGRLDRKYGRSKSSFTTFKELMQHQSRWRQIPLTTGKKGEVYGTRPSDWNAERTGPAFESGAVRESLKKTDVTKGEFYHYVWKKFVRFWLAEVKRTARKVYNVKDVPFVLLEASKDFEKVKKDLMSNAVDINEYKRQLVEIYHFRKQDIDKLVDAEIIDFYNKFTGNK